MSTRTGRGAAKTAEPAGLGTTKRSRRMPSKERKRDIITKAARFFAANGFDSGTRDLASYLGITQPLLYRYFPTKEALIKEVYQTVYLDVWRTSWDELLVDRARPLRDRLVQFYDEYTDVIMNEQWMRIYFFAGLRGVEINRLYIQFIEERILKRIIIEFLRDHGIHDGHVVERREMELAWLLQGSIFYYGVRLYVYHLETYASKGEIINDAVDMFLVGYRALLASRGLLPVKKGRRA